MINSLKIRTKLSLLLCFLSINLAQAQIPLAGELSGILEDTTYLVQDSIYVAYGDSLIIQPGAVFFFQGYYRFAIKGYLSAVGTELDSIYFMPDTGVSGWKSITFYDSSNADCILSYCYFTGSRNSAINVYFTDITISHCTIDNNNASWGGGIYVNSCSPLILECIVTDNISVNNGGGIYCTHASPVISDCIVSGNISNNGGSGSGQGGGGICANHSSNPLILNCDIFDNFTYDKGGGIGINDDSNTLISGCLIYNNSSDSAGGGIFCWASHPIIENCTINGNSNDIRGGGICIDWESLTEIYNTIVANNFGAGGIYITASFGVSLTYNDVFNNETGNFLGDSTLAPELGVLNGVNVNGDSCDFFQNIFLDPLFLDPLRFDFHLTANSPCIDAGDPENQPDPDGTIADIGAFYYQQGPLIIQNLTITIQGNDIYLDWQDMSGATLYHIYRSNTPYFDITGVTPLANSTVSSYVDAGALVDRVWFYRVSWE